jgi:membrane protein YqaA with SNARE-associated domain
MLKRAYDWVVSYASHPNAVWLLFAVTFVESSVSPIPPIPLLIPMCIARPDRAWFYALICSAGAVTGGFAGYAIGSLLYDTVGQWIIAFYGLKDKAAHLVQTSQDVWFWVLLTKGLTPIPFKIVTIMSGFLHFDLLKFTIGMIVSRVTFFMMIAVALYYYGDNVRLFIEKHLPMAALALLVIIVGGFFVLPFVL